MDIYDIDSLDNVGRAQAIYASGAVQRWHSNPDMARFGQTNAEHQWGCAALLMQLFPEHTEELMKALLTHDVGELWVGDLSGPTKKAMPELAAASKEVETRILAALGLREPLSQHEQDVIHFIDKLEAVMYVNRVNPALLYKYDWPRTMLEVVDQGVGLGITRHEVWRLIGGIRHVINKINT